MLGRALSACVIESFMIDLRSFLDRLKDLCRILRAFGARCESRNLSRHEKLLPRPRRPLSTWKPLVDAVISTDDMIC